MKSMIHSTIVAMALTIAQGGQATPSTTDSEPLRIQTITCENGLRLEKFSTISCEPGQDSSQDSCANYYTYDAFVTNGDAISKFRRATTQEITNRGGLIDEFWMQFAANDQHLFGANGFADLSDALFAMNQENDAIRIDILASENGAAGENYVFYNCR